MKDNIETRVIPSFSKYRVSIDGRVFSSTREMKVQTSTLGYKFIGLSQEKNNRKSSGVHRLVYEAWIGELKPGLDINHLDGDKANNHVSNLEQVTRSENQKHAHRIGLATKVGENNTQSKLSDVQIIEIRKLLESGLSQRKIAKQYNVTQPVISYISTGICWNHVKDKND